MARYARLFWVFMLVFSVAFAPGCGDGNLKEARRYQESEDYGQAAHFFRLALEKDPENRSIRYGLVEVLAQELTQTPPEQLTAEIVEETMLEVGPIAEPLMDDPNIKRYMLLIYQILAQRYGEQEMDEKAADTWGRIIEIDPSMAEGHYNMGVALVKLGKTEEAMQRFEKSVDLNPYLPKSYYGMGNIYLEAGQHEDAIENFLKALEINPDDLEIRHNLGVAYSLAGNVDKAIAELEKAIKAQPDYFLAYRSLAAIYKGKDDQKMVAEIDKRWEEFAKAHVAARKKAEQAESE
jgi:tetratricopeptide (TPR) repeat protein